MKYVFKKRNSDYLIVGFSGIPKIGTPPNYNYAKTLVNTEINQLFILDHHGMIGCYYLGENKEFAVERSVYELIEKIRVENNICKENVITFGSSKGGYAALYFSFKYGYGNVISASPQTKLGHYLIEQVIAGAYIAHFIAGGTKDNHKNYLDNLLFDVVKKAEKSPNIRIHVGEGEMHYKKHVIPLLEEFDKCGFKYILNLGPYSSHNDVATFYPPYLLESIEEITKG